jgi:hypothetical protein
LVLIQQQELQLSLSKKELYRVMATRHLSDIVKTGVVLSSVELLDWGVTSTSGPEIPILTGTTGRIAEVVGLSYILCVLFRCAEIAHYPYRHD